MRYIRQLKSKLNNNKDRNITKILSHLKNLNFWIFLKQARDILKSLHQIQYFSEAKNYSLSRVLHNWNKIRADLYFKAKKYSHIKCLKDIADDVWELQLLQQSTSLHVIVALLLSQNHDIKVVDLMISLTFSSIMLIFFDRYSFCRSDATSVMKQWLAFWTQTDEFRSQVECWRWIDYSKLFWLCCESFVSQLAKLCLRVNKISGNFVLVERDWSIMNLIKSKTRNQLSNVSVDKLMYIYINERTLNRSRELKKRLRYTRLTVEPSFHTYFLTRPSTRYQCRDSARILDTNLVTRLGIDLEPSQDSGSRLDPPSNRKFRVQWEEILITTRRSFPSRTSTFRIHGDTGYY